MNKKPGIFGLVFVMACLAFCNSSPGIDQESNSSNYQAQGQFASTPTGVLRIATSTKIDNIGTDVPVLQSGSIPSGFVIPTDIEEVNGLIGDYPLCSPLEEETFDTLREIISDPYHPPPPGRDERHHGVDFAYYRRGERLSIEGIGIQAILGGRIAAVIENRLPYGNMLIVETPIERLPLIIKDQLGVNPGESLYHLYAHMLYIPTFQAGEWVTCGQVIGQVGKTGYNIVEPHLHLETRIGPANQVFESMAYYDTRATQIETTAYLRWRTSGEFEHFDPMLLFDTYLNMEIP